MSEIIMDDVATLLAIEEIKMLKARYFRCVDTKDWAGYAAVFADDVHFDISADVPGCILHNPQAIVDMAKAGLNNCVSVHHGHCPEIHITSDTTAEGVWAMEDVLRWNDGAASPVRGLNGYGHYVETYRKIDGAWRIQTMKLTRLRVDVVAWENAA
jgi:hypothetical protein